MFNIIFKILFTLFVLILVPVYWQVYGLQNFLWLSDVGLFLTTLSIWFNSSLLMSMAIIGIFPFEVMWNLEFFSKILTGYSLTGIANYMLNPEYPIILKILSLFHIFLPFIWLWYLIKIGYNKSGFKFASILVGIILVLTYFFSTPERDINRIFLAKVYHWPIPEWLWLIFLIFGYPLIVFYPVHKLLGYLISKKIIKENK